VGDGQLRGSSEHSIPRVVSWFVRGPAVSYGTSKTGHRRIGRSRERGCNGVHSIRMTSGRPRRACQWIRDDAECVPNHEGGLTAGRSALETPTIARVTKWTIRCPGSPLVHSWKSAPCRSRRRGNLIPHQEDSARQTALHSGHQNDGGIRSQNECTNADAQWMR
jgi:hypothetical protein